MKIKQILMAIVFTAVLVSCGSTDPKEAGKKAGKEVCEKLKSGNFSQSDAQKFMEEAKASMDNPEDAAIWEKAYMAVLVSCESTDPKEAGKKAGKEVCEKLKSGNFSQSDAQKFMEEAKASMDNPEDAAIWYKAYMAKVMDCMN